jgi:hypothetical protein
VVKHANEAASYRDASDSLLSGRHFWTFASALGIIREITRPFPGINPKCSWSVPWFSSSGLCGYTAEEVLMILTIEHRKIEPDVVVMEMHGRITMGGDSQRSNGV